MRFMRGEGDSFDVEIVQAAYKGLKPDVAEYYERRLEVLEEADLWFATAVTDCFDDLYSRGILQK